MERKMNIGKKLAVIFRGEINNKYPKSKRFQFIKTTNQIFPHIVWGAPIKGAHTFYTDVNKSGKAGYKSQNLNNLSQSPYNLIQKSELYALLMVLLIFLNLFISFLTLSTQKELFHILKPLNLFPMIQNYLCYLFSYRK